MICNKRLSAESTQTNASANDYVTKSEMDTAISAIPDPPDPPDLTGLIEKEEDGIKAENGEKDLDIITLGDSNTGEIRFGPESSTEGNNGVPRAFNSVITKGYLENIIKEAGTGMGAYIVLGSGFEDPGLKFANIEMNPFTWGKLTFNVRLTAGSTQSGATANDYVTKKEVDALIAAAIAKL
jgi:hypothetical protein